MDSDHALNLGADARINGEPLSANPYLGGDWTERMAWQRGWRDCDRHYGEEVARRTFRALPAVRPLAKEKQT